MSQIAFSGPDGKVDLWCQMYSGGKCYVINGAWEFIYDQKTKTSTATNMAEGFKECWRGKAPFSSSEYQEAIQWIEEQIKSGVNYSPEYQNPPEWAPYSEEEDNEE